MTEFAPPSPNDSPYIQPVRPSPLSKEGAVQFDGINPDDFLDQPLKRLYPANFPEPKIEPDKHDLQLATMDQRVVDRGVEMVVAPKTPDVAAAVAVSHTVQVG